MAEYHVGCRAFAIYAGTLNAKNKNLWQNKTQCTDEAINAVRDYMVQELLGGFDCMKAKTSGYEWTLKDGMVVESRNGACKLAIQAPKSFKIYREEIYVQIKLANLMGQEASPALLDKASELLANKNNVKIIYDIKYARKSNKIFKFNVF